MFVDASVIVAILRREPGYDELEQRLVASDGPFFVSPLVRFEAAVSFARARSGATRKPSADLLRESKDVVDRLIAVLGAEEIAITAEIGDSALEASIRYGKAVGHPAALNFGDCFAYACAKSLKVELLYKGNDFAATDVG